MSYIYSHYHKDEKTLWFVRAKASCLFVHELRLPTAEVVMTTKSLRSVHDRKKMAEFKEEFNSVKFEGASE